MCESGVCVYVWVLLVFSPPSVAPSCAMPTPMPQECGNDCLNFIKHMASFGSIFTNTIKKRSSCKVSEEPSGFAIAACFNDQVIKIQFDRNYNRCFGAAGLRKKSWFHSRVKPQPAEAAPAALIYCTR